MPDKIMAGLHDASGVLRAYGVAETRDAAQEQAWQRLREQLDGTGTPEAADAPGFTLRFVPLPEAHQPRPLQRNGGLLRSALRRRRRR